MTWTVLSRAPSPYQKTDKNRAKNQNNHDIPEMGLGFGNSQIWKKSMISSTYTGLRGVRKALFPVYLNPDNSSPSTV